MGKDSGNYPIEFSLLILKIIHRFKEFHDMLVAFDNHLVDLAYNNRKEWFGAKLAKANRILLKVYILLWLRYQLIKKLENSNGKYPPRFGFKINMWEGKHQCKVYDDVKTISN